MLADVTAWLSGSRCGKALHLARKAATSIALRKAFVEARAAYLKAEEQYQEATQIASDTKFNPDGAHGLRNAPQKSAAALAEYSAAMMQWAAYLGAAKDTPTPDA